MPKRYRKGRRIENAHEEVIWNVAWSSSEKKIITGSADETVKIWDSNSFDLVGLISDLGYAPLSIDINSDSTSFLVATMDHSIHEYSLLDYQLQRAFYAGAQNAWKSRYVGAADTRKIVSGTGDGCVAVWALDDIVQGGSSNENKMTSRLRSGSEARITSIRPGAYRKSGSSTDTCYVAAGNSAGQVFVFDLTTEKLVYQPVESSIAATNATIRDIKSVGPLIYTCSDGGNVVCFDSRYKSAVFNIRASESIVFGIDINSDGDMLSTGSIDDNVKIFDIKTRSQIISFYGNTGVGSRDLPGIWDVCFESGGLQRLACVGGSKSVQFYNPV